MSRYLYSAKNSAGRQFSGRISADSLGEARKRLEAQGCRDILFHNDDVEAKAVGMEVDRELIEEYVTPQEEVKMRRNTLAEAVFDSVQRSLWLYAAVAMGVLLLFYWISSPVLRGAVVILATGGCLYISSGLIPIVLHQKLWEAREWHRWDEVERLVKSIRSFNHVLFIKVPESELGYRMALVLGGRKQFDGALTELEKSQTQCPVADWIYQARIGDIYVQAENFPEAIACYRTAVEMKPNDASALIAFAQILILARDFENAQAALQLAEKFEVVELARPHLKMCKGQIANAKGHHQEAADLLRESLNEVEKMSNPMMGGTTHLIKAELSVALAKTGKREEGLRLYRSSRAYLEATDAKDSLKRCREAFGE